MATKYLTVNGSGLQAEVATVSTSAGAGDVDKIPSLNAAGILTDSILNTTVASAGAGDAGKRVQLDSSGKLDTTVMPTGIGADTASIIASELIAAGAYVNITNNAGTPSVRNADASNGREAHGFTLLGAASSAACVVYMEGRNTAVSGRTPGATQFLSGSTPGAGTETVPTTAGHILQTLGAAVTTTSVDFEKGRPIVRA